MNKEMANVSVKKYKTYQANITLIVIHYSSQQHHDIPQKRTASCDPTLSILFTQLSETSITNIIFVVIKFIRKIYIYMNKNMLF